MTLARICQRAENAFVGVQCGLMDQFASSCGVDGSAVLLDCRSLEWRPVALPGDVVIVVLHTGSPRSLNASEYNARRSQCETAVAELARDVPSIASLRDVTLPVLLAAQDRMDPVAFRRARHIVTENERVGEAIAAFAADDLAAVGRLFAASHASLRDDFEVVSPELDAMVEIASAVPGVVAARMTGAGFGGSTVNLVRPAAVEALRAAVERDYPARTGLQPRVLPGPRDSRRRPARVTAAPNRPEPGWVRLPPAFPQRHDVGSRRGSRSLPASPRRRPVRPGPDHAGPAPA